MSRIKETFIVHGLHASWIAHLNDHICFYSVVALQFTQLSSYFALQITFWQLLVWLCVFFFIFFNPTEVLVSIFLALSTQRWTATWKKFITNMGMYASIGIYMAHSHSRAEKNSIRLLSKKDTPTGINQICVEGRTHVHPTCSAWTKVDIKRHFSLQRHPPRPVSKNDTTVFLLCVHHVHLKHSIQHHSDYLSL